MPSLSTILRLNAASCLLFGGLFVIVPQNVSEFLGSAPSLVISLVGCALLFNGAHLIFASRRAVTLPWEIAYFVLGDALWVFASVVLITTGIFVTTPFGILASLAVACGVATLGFLQFRVIRQ